MNLDIYVSFIITTTEISQVTRFTNNSKENKSLTKKYVIYITM